tara:strand:+ start:178 stop:1332 length:1155 start_codon:yes stop_codon:yes gene_type:complete
VNIEKPIFLDNQSTTALDSRVFEKMSPFFKEDYGNPHSTHHSYGREASEAINTARKAIASNLNANHQDIYFTSGATESNNILIKGLGSFSKVKSKRIISLKSEHKCVLQSCKRLEEDGFEVIYLSPKSDGLVDLDELENALNEPTFLTSIMFVNNETGVIQPMKKIGELCRDYESVFHTDAAQAAGKIDIDVEELNIDALSISGHKMYGPKGIGVLYVNTPTRLQIKPLFDGGGQEKELRSGTLPTPLCVGLSEAFNLSLKEKDQTNDQIIELRLRMLEILSNSINDLKVNGSNTSRIEGNLNIMIPGIDAEVLINNMPEIAISTGSACTSGFVERSHVLQSMGMTDEEASYSFRIGIGKHNTREEIETASNTIINAVNKIKKN